MSIVENTIVESEHKFWLFFDSQSSYAIDGDTLDGYVIGYAWPEGNYPVPEKIGEQSIIGDQHVRLRYLGVDTFESVGDPYKYRNWNRAKCYGVDMEILNEAAIEAKHLNDTLLESKRIIAVSLQYDVATMKPTADYFGRLLGVVYATDYTSWEEAAQAAKDGYFKAININKELLKPMYSNYIQTQKDYAGSIMVPLAEFTGYDYASKNDGIRIADWGAELGLSVPPMEEITKVASSGITPDQLVKDAEIEQAVKAYKTDYKDKGHVREDISQVGYLNNDLAFVPPVDDRISNGTIYAPTADMGEELPWDYQNRVRIGDVFITIPPLSIRLDKQFQNQKVSTMRAKSSLQKQVGNVRNILSMDLYYRDLESVNGTETVGYVTAENETIYYYMDGLRPLLAQFKKAPFLPIDNEYINSVLGVHNVALRSMQAATVPGFPGAMKVTLVVEEFDSAPYLMGQMSLAQKINYPLLRWYYQRSLHEPFLHEPWRTYLPKIDRLDNSFTFSIVNEEQLKARKDNIHEFRSKQTPYEFEQDLLADDTEDGRKYQDALRAQAVLKQYHRFLLELQRGGILEKYDALDKYDHAYEIPIMAGGGVSIENNTENKIGREFAVKMYGESTTKDGRSVDMPFFLMGIFADAVKTPANAFFTLYSFSNDVGPFFEKLRKNNRTDIVDVVMDSGAPGFFQLYLEAEENKKTFKDTKAKAYGGDTNGDDPDSELFLIPATDAGAGQYLTKLKKIAELANTFENKVANHTSVYNGLAAEINRSEENMKMDTVFIPDLIPLDMSVELENNFSTVQVQTATTPTMQYFGSQDPQLQITFETTDAGVQATEAMFRKVGHFAKEYREGLVSGFLGIDNPLVNLFGITNVLPQAVQYNTVAGFPDRKIVTVTLSSFDKTQRRQESLYGFTGGDITDTLRDRAYDKYDPSIDSVYVHERLRQMELYPDLDMPKVSELNAALPHLNARMKEWENRTDQVFLDPDFYISTNDTYRKYLKDVVDDNRDMLFRWEDASGYVAESSLAEKNPLKMSPTDQARFETEAAETEYIDPTLIWDDGFTDETKDAAESVTAATLKTVQPAEYENAEIIEYLSSGSYKNPPSFLTWQSWHGKDRDREDYNKWKAQLGSPLNDVKVWWYLADCIMTAFADCNIEYAPKEEESLKKKELVSTNASLSSQYEMDFALGRLVWANAEDYYQKIYAMMTGTIGAGKLLENGKVPDAFADGDYFGGAEALLDAFSDEKPMPFHRIFSYMKAIIQTESGWQQFKNGEALVYDINKNQMLPTKAGLMGARLTKAKNASEAQRLIWDWFYNMKTTVNQIAKVFKRAEVSGFREIFARRLDWAVVANSGATLPKILNIKKDTKLTKELIASVDLKDGFQNGPITPDSSIYFQAVMKTRERERAMATEDIAPGLYMGRNSTIIREIYDFYNATKSSYAQSYDPAEGEYVETGVITERKQEQMDANYAKDVEQIHNNVENWTPEQKLKGMFVDMYQYDQTGRMLRAFPTFSMQIVDEGKWYDNFRTWDNFYGFNALQSIDVYKSRKIAADTAVISMSNMYGGLTSKRKDMEYPDLILPSFFSSQFWEQYVFDTPTEDLLKERQLIFKTMMLETGARIHLRMGYGSDARYLPVVFNGVITEVSAGDVVQITAQGDGLELSNVISGSENDKNKEFMKIIEPSDYIGKLLTSKGNWIKNWINAASDGQFFKENPLGIAHFGSTIEAPSGTYNPFSSSYGESMQNVYSQNGQFTKEQWMKPDGTTVGAVQGLFGGLPSGNLTSKYDEDNILVKLYGSTPWDIIQTFALCSTDYIAAVMPFEMRSSLFFGKPHWPVTYKYNNRFTHDAATGKWRKEIIGEHKKTFMQAHIYSSAYNIVANDIISSEEGVYNNVIVTYDGHVAGPMQADNDIQLDRQKTAMVEANLVGRFGTDGNITQFFGKNYWTTEAQAEKYGMATVRDYMKDMYKGSYTVLGDPTVKPYDSCYLSDTVLDMQGVHMVKAVHHSMSLDTGFITVIEPDAYVVNFDAELLFLPDKIFTVGKTVSFRAAASAINLGNSYLFGGHVLSYIYSELGSLAVKFQPYADKYVGGILKKGYINYYRKMGELTDSPSLLELVSRYEKANHEAFDPNSLLDSDIDDIIADIKKTKESLRDARKTYKAKKKELKYSKYSNFVTEAFDETKVAKRSITKFDDFEMWEQLFAHSDELDTLKDEWKVVRNTGNLARMVDTAGTVGKGTSKILKTGGKLFLTVASSALFWTVIADVALEVLTSGLIEMWTRRKQNSECVKVVPLQYKGSAWVSGMNGHRGGVWGDDPSLADRIYDAEFFDADEGSDSWWVFVPKLLNLMEGENLADDLNDAKATESAEKQEAE